MILSYLQGDEASFRSLIEAQLPELRARLERRMAPLLRRRVSVHDVMQEVSMIAFQRRADFTGSTPEDFRRWVIGIADLKVHEHVNHHAGTQKRALYQEVSRRDEDETVHPVCSEASPSQQAIGAELAKIAAEALEQLPPDYREVLRLHREGGKSLREIAIQMGRSHDATRQLHGRAMVRFTEHFERLRGEEHDGS